MKNILTQIFVGLGVIFLILIIIGAYFFITDPYNLKPLIFGSDAVTTPQKSVPTTSSTNDTTGESTGAEATGGFTLSEAQKQALVSYGIDPATVPTSISATQEMCFTSALGAPRVADIKAGAVPSALELLKAKSCI